jgi:ribA/ribD-fused uncharacterized protein
MTPVERLAALITAEAAGEPIEMLHFWGHQPNRDGSVGPGCLSQWWSQPFTVDGFVYPSAEHFMMAGKARLFGDQDALAAVYAAASPGAAKAVGRRVRDFDDTAWKRAAYDIVVAGNLAKFGQNPDLWAFLRATGRTVLVEASPRDRIWGIGMGRENPDAQRPSAWRGRNLLGFALMEVRERLGSDFS